MVRSIRLLGKGGLQKERSHGGGSRSGCSNLEDFFSAQARRQRRPTTHPHGAEVFLCPHSLYLDATRQEGSKSPMPAWGRLCLCGWCITCYHSSLFPPAPLAQEGLDCLLTLSEHREALNTHQQSDVSQSVLAQITQSSRMGVSAALICCRKPAAAMSLEEGPVLHIPEPASSLLLLPESEPKERRMVFLCAP